MMNNQDYADLKVFLSEKGMVRKNGFFRTYDAETTEPVSSGHLEEFVALYNPRSSDS